MGVIFNFYQVKHPVGKFFTFDLGTVIYHGHDEQTTCCAKTMCHVLGYAPTGSESPLFLKRWRNTWET